MDQKKRNPGFELLRVIAMLMIVTLHYNAYTGSLLHTGLPATGVSIFANIIEAFCIPGVNTYVLISGFFLSRGKVRPSRILQLLCQVYFYVFAVAAVLRIIGAYTPAGGTSAYSLIEYLFPISTEQYWFVTAYVIMYVLAPVMNIAVEKLERKQIRAVIIGLLIWFCFIKSAVPIFFSTDKYGYDYGWFICLYLIAAYIRRYDIKLFSDAKKSITVYLVSSAIIAVMSISLYYVNYNFGGFAHYSGMPFSYNFFFTLTGSLGLFSFFRQFHMKETKAADVLRFMGPLTLGVYLLHMHIEVRDHWVEWLTPCLGPVPDYSIPLFAFHALRAVIIVFISGIFVDWIRKGLFDGAGRLLKDTKLFAFVRRLDEELC